MTINVYTLLVGIVASGIVEILKRIKSVPLNEGQTKALRFTTAGIVLLGTLLTEYQNAGTLSDNTVNLLSEGIVSYFFAFLTYKGVFSKGTTAQIQERIG